MTWAFTKDVNWAVGEEPTRYDNQPVDANTLIYAGTPCGLNPGSTPVNCVRPAVAGDVFAGFAVRRADNLTADATQPNILYNQNVGDGTTGIAGCKVRLLVDGVIRLDGQAPNASGVSGTPTGLAGTQADVNVDLYYNGTGFTNSSAGSALHVGRIIRQGSSVAGVAYWDLQLRSDIVRNS